MSGHSHAGRNGCTWALAAALAVTMTLTGQTARGENAVVNGDFSSNAALFTTWPGYTGGANPAAIDDWTHTGATGINGEGIEVPFRPSNDSAARYYVILQRNTSSIRQSLSLQPGRVYYIAFLAANRKDNADAAGRVVVADNATTYYDSGSTVWGSDAFHAHSGTFITPHTIRGEVRITLYNSSPGGDKTVCYGSVEVSDSALLFEDDFDAAASTSITSPNGRAAGILKSVVAYQWSKSNDIGVNGTLDWDAGGTKTNQNQFATSNGEQNLRLSDAVSKADFDLAPHVANGVWEVEFDQRVAWSHPLTFGLSDDPRGGEWNGWDSGSYDFAAGSYGSALRYDTDDDAGLNATATAGGFPYPPTEALYHFRIRFDEPAGMATVWINGTQRATTTSLDFENPGRYLSWGEPNLYAGAMDNLRLSLDLTAIDVPPPPGSVLFIQ